MKRLDRLIPLVLVLLTACTPTAASVTATPRPTPTLPPPYYVGSVKAPGGRTLATESCYSFGTDYAFWVLFPNGRRLAGDLRNGGGGLSPDGSFAIVDVGGNHDSPPTGMAVWDMLGGTVIDNLPLAPFGWDPSQPHILVYLRVEANTDGLDRLVELDAVSQAETQLPTCPDWFRFISQINSVSCANFPGVNIGGRFFGLPDDLQVRLSVRVLDGCGAEWPSLPLAKMGWSQKLRNYDGSVYSITPLADGYLSTPLSYTVEISGTEAYVVVNGTITPEKSDHLDFRFDKVK